jgi:hypothetical protein
MSLTDQGRQILQQRALARARGTPAGSAAQRLVSTMDRLGMLLPGAAAKIIEAAMNRQADGRPFDRSRPTITMESLDSKRLVSEPGETLPPAGDNMDNFIRAIAYMKGDGAKYLTKPDKDDNRPELVQLLERVGLTPISRDLVYKDLAVPLAGLEGTELAQGVFRHLALSHPGALGVEDRPEVMVPPPPPPRERPPGPSITDVFLGQVKGSI